MVDKSYWSAGPRDDPRYASQQTLYNDLGVELLDHSFEGFNTCIFACKSTVSSKLGLDESQTVKQEGKRWHGRWLVKAETIFVQREEL